MAAYVVDAQGKRVNTAEIPVTNEGTYGLVEPFMELLEMHLVRLGINHALQVLLIADGAEWIWLRIPPGRERLGCSPESIVELLDFYHAAEHLQSFALAAFTKPEDAQTWFKQARGLLKQGRVAISGVDFTKIDGMGALTVQTILSEVGLDPSRFPTVKHFTSWLGLCPGSYITGGKAKISRTRRVINRATNAFRMAAQAASKTRSALGAFYRRLRTRLGAPKAITATAHKLARIFYQLWTLGVDYHDPGMNYYEQRYQEQLVKGLRSKAQALGFDLIATSSAQIVS